MIKVSEELNVISGKPRKSFGTYSNRHVTRNKEIYIFLFVIELFAHCTVPVPTEGIFPRPVHPSYISAESTFQPQEISFPSVEIVWIFSGISSFLIGSLNLRYEPLYLSFTI